jgi:polyphosphate kinase 2 (PPK2 family)
MFETAELGRCVTKAEFKKTAPKLREELLRLQTELHDGGHFQVILVIAGVDGGGKSETVSQLNEWMDPAWLMTRAYDEITEDERERPEYWRYWRDLPPRGRIGMFLSAWYSAPVLDRVYEVSDEATFLRRIERIVSFERALADDGALILKYWMHLGREAQEHRLKSLERDPLTRARVTERDWKNWRHYDRFIGVAEHLIAHTNKGSAPWIVVEGADANYRALTVAGTLRDALRRKLPAVPGAPGEGTDVAPKPTPANKTNSKKRRGSKNEKAGNHRIRNRTHDTVTVLDRLDMSKALAKADYQEQLIEQQARLHALHLRARERKISSVLLFEGPDAAGKGGAIRRVCHALEVRNYQVNGIAAPTDEEKAQHYLWRFWRLLSRGGHVTIFDRSWYGRVLVERVEGFAAQDEWRRSYGEINEFEDQLIEHGIVLLKFWLHITEDEQLSRFKFREKTSYKRWKLTEEDWRNRSRWNEYEDAVNDIVQFTSTAAAPWTLVEGNDKRYARVRIVREFADRLEQALSGNLEKMAVGSEVNENIADRAKRQ